jgi:hypothetical protein
MVLQSREKKEERVSKVWFEGLQARFKSEARAARYRMPLDELIDHVEEGYQDLCAEQEEERKNHSARVLQVESGPKRSIAPCYKFSKGQCERGNECPYSHVIMQRGQGGGAVQNQGVKLWCSRCNRTGHEIASCWKCELCHEVHKPPEVCKLKSSVQRN